MPEDDVGFSRTISAAGNPKFASIWNIGFGSDKLLGLYWLNKFPAKFRSNEYYSNIKSVINVHLYKNSNAHR